MIETKDWSNSFLISRGMRQIIRGNNSDADHYELMIGMDRLLEIDMQDLTNALGQDLVDQIIDLVDWYGGYTADRIGIVVKEYFDAKFGCEIGT